MDSNTNHNLVDESIPDAPLGFQLKPNYALVDLLQQHTQNFQNNPERCSLSQLTKPTFLFKSLKFLPPQEF